MKKYLTTGFIILLPLALTLWLVTYVVDIFTAPLYEIVSRGVTYLKASYALSFLKYETLVPFLSRSTALLITLILIFILGFFAQKFFFNSLIDIAGNIVARLPVVGTVYRLTKDITEAMLSPGQKTFKETVLVPFPGEETYALAFITGDVPENLKKVIQETDVTIFVPTAPHPISGYMLFAPRKWTQPVEVSSEETLKFLFSCGVVSLEKGKNEP